MADASSVIPLLVPEPFSLQAEQLLAGSETNSAPLLYAPELLYAECANALWKYVRRGQLSREEAQASLMDLLDLGILAVPLAELVGRALEVAVATGTTVYDACYVVLAEELDLELVTTDEALVRLCHGRSLRACLLQSLQ